MKWLSADFFLQLYWWGLIMGFADVVWLLRVSLGLGLPELPLNSQPSFAWKKELVDWDNGNRSRSNSMWIFWSCPLLHISCISAKHPHSCPTFLRSLWIAAGHWEGVCSALRLCLRRWCQDLSTGSRHWLPISVRCGHAMDHAYHAMDSLASLMLTLTCVRLQLGTQAGSTSLWFLNLKKTTS